MAFTNYIQQIKDTGGTTHDLVDTSASHYVKGTQTSSTNAWTGALPDGVTAYYDGLSIDYFLPYAGTSTAATLNLGSKGAKPVYVGNGTGGVTTHFPVNSVIHLTYIVNSALNSGNGCWKVTGYYNTNDDYRVRTVARGTTKAYVLGTTTEPTSSNQNVTSVSETGVYFDTTAATLVATTFKGALTGTASGNLTSSSTLDATKLSGTIPTSCYTNTKNTAGSTDTSSKIFLIGATSQAANPQTYSHDTAYVGTDGCLYSGGTKVLTAHQTYTSFTGKPTGNQTPSFGGTFTIQQISQSTAGQVSGTDRTVTIPATIATNTAVGLVKPWYTHTAASTGPTTGNNTTAVTVNAISTTSSRYYAVEADSNGRLFVNVPWKNDAASQATDTGSAWRKILGTHNSSSSIVGSVGTAAGTGYYKNNDGPAFQPSTGIVYAPQMYISLATNEALYTNLQNLGWTDSIKTIS